MYIHNNMYIIMISRSILKYMSVQKFTSNIF